MGAMTNTGNTYRNFSTSEWHAGDVKYIARIHTFNHEGATVQEIGEIEHYIRDVDGIEMFQGFLAGVEAAKWRRNFREELNGKAAP